MKRLFLAISLVVLSFTLFAQQWNGNNNINDMIWRNGKVGIGTSLPSELLTLHSYKSYGLLLSLSASWDSNKVAKIGFMYNQFDAGKIVAIKEGVYKNNDAASSNSALSFFTAENGVNIEKLRILSSGNVGIGTTLPSELLTLHSDKSHGLLFSLSASWDSNKVAKIGFKYNQFDAGKIVATKEGVYKYNDAASSNSALSFFTAENGVNSEKLRISSNGNVGIGTIKTGSYLLTVNGVIGAKEIEVTNDITAYNVNVNSMFINSQPTADFVFEDDYNLRPIEEVESFIDENKHLPDVASANDMKENGINQAEMNQKLLQKIEELTLYVIDLNKRMKLVEEENKSLKEENNTLKAK